MNLLEPTLTVRGGESWYIEKMESLIARFELADKFTEVFSLGL